MISEEVAKQRAKKEITRLINLYESDKDKYSETDVESKLVAPLFEALGWNMSGKLSGSSVYQRKKQQDKRLFPDFTVKIGDRTQFFIEAKSLEFNGLHYNRSFVKQAIGYGWNAGITWVVLTNFKELVIYNADWGFKDELQNRFWRFGYNEYLDRLEELWKLSFYAFPRGGLNKEAEKAGKRAKRIRIDDALLKDLLMWRDKLIKNIQKHNSESDISKEYAEEIVQTILNRLIFIRFTEDRQQVDPQLKARMLRASFAVEFTAVKMLAKIFRDYDKWYNSEIFAGDFITYKKLKISNKLLIDIIKELYENKKSGLPYIFSQIDADVLGNLYENYIEQIQKKKEGIYYTPTYIVKYIVENTVGELLKTKKPEDIKILDPACGSASFLIKAFDRLKEHYEDGKSHYQENLSAFTDVSDRQFKRDMQILKNSIFGVDKDLKATEIARLNLLLKAAEKKAVLPTINDNIQWGDSLIDDEKLVTHKQLAKSFEDRFPNIKGFDIVIGNPPYISFGLRGSKRYSDVVGEYLRTAFPNSAEYKLSTYAIFMEKAISLLKDQSYFGFIIPDSFLVGRYFSKVRKYILDTCQIKNIVLFEKDFWKATVGIPIIIILKREQDNRKRSNNLMKITKVKDLESFTLNKTTSFSYKQDYFERQEYNRFRLFFNKYEKKIIDSIGKREYKKLGDILEPYSGCISKFSQKSMISESATAKVYFRSKDNKIEYSDDSASNKWKPVLKSGSEVNRYNINYIGNYIYIEPDETRRKKYVKSGFDLDRYKSPKLFMRQTGDRLTATYDEKGFFCINNMHILNRINKKFKLKSVLALINSKVLTYYYQTITLESGRTMAQTDIETIERLPIPKISEQDQDKLSILVDKMLELNKQLQKLKDIPGREQDFIKKEIEETDKKIDQMVYKLYGLTKEEIKIVEDSLK